MIQFGPKQDPMFMAVLEQHMAIANQIKRNKMIIKMLMERRPLNPQHHCLLHLERIMYRQHRHQR